MIRNKSIIVYLGLLVLCTSLLAGCGKKSKNIEFMDEEDEEIVPLSDSQANDKIQITDTKKQNEEFKIEYKTYDPDGVGVAKFKLRSLKEIDKAGTREPSEGMKLILAEISIIGDSKNKGYPSTFNQIGDRPSPQFVLVNKDTNKSDVEATYFSDGYTEAKKLFELSKITMDHDKWVNTAIVFEIPKDQKIDIVLRYTNVEGKTEFIDVNE